MQLQADAKGSGPAQGLGLGFDDGDDNYRGGVHPKHHHHHHNNNDLEDLDGMEDNRHVRKNLLNEMKEVSGDKRGSGEFSLDGRRDGNVGVTAGGRCSPPTTSRHHHPEQSDDHNHDTSSSSTTFPYRQVIIPDIAEEKSAVSGNVNSSTSTMIDRSVVDRTVHGGGLWLGPGTVTRSTVGNSSKQPQPQPQRPPPRASAKDNDRDDDQEEGEEDDDAFGLGSTRRDNDVKRLSFSSTGKHWHDT